MIDYLGKPGWILYTLGLLVVSLGAGLVYMMGAALWAVAASWCIQILVFSGIVIFARRSIDNKRQEYLDSKADFDRKIETHQGLQELTIQTSQARYEADTYKSILSYLLEKLRCDTVELELADPTTEGRIQYLATPGGVTSTLMVAESEIINLDQLGDPGEAEPFSYTITVNEQKSGELLLNRNHTPFTNDEIRIISWAASLIQLSVQGSQLRSEARREQQETEERAAEMQLSERSLQLFLRLSNEASSSSDMNAMLQALVDNIGSFLGMDGVLLFLWEANRSQLRPAAAYGPLRQSIRGLQVDPADIPFAYTVIDSHKPMTISDLNRSVYIRARAAAQMQSRSLLALPLFVERQAVGVLVLTYQQSHAFSSQETELGQQAARQAAAAITRAQSLQAERRRAQELGALQKATSILMSTLDLDNLLGQILDAALSALPAAQRSALHLIARDTGQLQLRAVQGYKDPRIRMLSMTGGSSYAARSVHERRPILIEDTRSDPVRVPVDTAELTEAGSSIIAPLMVGDEILGAISLEAFHRYAFAGDDLQLLVSFAATAATAIKNAQLHGEVQKQAITDTLTGLYNRRGFLEFGRREVERALRFNRHLSALLLDLDFFKEINDQYGHHFGDKVIISVTQRWSQELRQIDLLGRFGGDEFVALLPETELESAQQVADRLRRTVSSMSFPIGPQIIHITMSVGAAGLDETCRDLESLLQRADKAMYEAKRDGRNRVVMG